MTRIIMVCALLAAFAGGAAATEIAEDKVGYRIDVPGDVLYGPELSATVVRDFANVQRYRNAALRTNGKAFADTDRGIAIYILWLTTDQKVSAPEAAVAAELDARRKRPAAAGRPGTIEVAKWAPVVTDKLISADLEFLDKGAGILTRVRSLIFLDAEGRIHEVNAECVLRDDASAETRAACEKTVASLEVTVPAEQRTSFAVAAPELSADRLALNAPDPEPAPAPPAADPAPAAPAAGGPTGASIGPAGDGKPLLVNPPQPARGSRRWMLYAGALLLVIALVWVARRRRDNALGASSPQGANGEKKDGEDA
jgi:hypothetical protein